MNPASLRCMQSRSSPHCAAKSPRDARLLGALDAYPAKLAAEVDFGGPIHRRSHALLVELLENSLGSEARERFAAEGRWMSIDMAVAEASLV